MFRVTQFLREIPFPTPPGPRRRPPGPVVIFNLLRRCNLACQHCYSISADVDFPDELSTPDILRTIEDLRAFGVPALILSGGEPLLHPDLCEIGARAKALGLYVGLSTNGTLIDEARAEALSHVGFDYVGISLDGIEATHDRFRRKAGAYRASLAGLRLARDAGMKVGLRFTLTQDNAHDLPALLELMEAERVTKFYLSHLNYGGRGNVNRKTDAVFRTTRQAMDLVFDVAWGHLISGREGEFVTGNNDADGVYLLRWVRARFPQHEARIRAKLAQWGGNASGMDIANIDNLGNVHPDTFWWDVNLGNIRERPFSAIWRDPRDPLMQGLRTSPRPVTGRCRRCAYFDVCGGNTRVRAWQLTRDPWAEDPGCYLDDDELGIAAGGPRLTVFPYHRSAARRTAAPTRARVVPLKDVK
jgi:heme d1 biosynthesis radical SAM protein NirJ